MPPDIGLCRSPSDGRQGDAIDTTRQTYVLYFFTVSGTTTTSYFSVTATNFAFNDGDWLQWTNLNLLLSPNATYAYGFSRTASGTGWDQLANASNNPYASGQIALVPVGGGAITYGASGKFDGVFDLGLTLTNLAGQIVLPIVTNSAATSLAPNGATLNGQILSSGNQVQSSPVMNNRWRNNPSTWAYSTTLGLHTGAFSA